jgi:hypothetical protein
MVHIQYIKQTLKILYIPRNLALSLQYTRKKQVVEVRFEGFTLLTKSDGLSV